MKTTLLALVITVFSIGFASADSGSQSPQDGSDTVKIIREVR